MAADRFDLLVIGGGVNGLGVARDAAARGLAVCLVERNDFGCGTSAASSRLIHGGLRYLQYGELGLVRESLRERGLLARQRPHRIRPIRLLIPLFHGRPPAGWQVALGLTLYRMFGRDPLFPPPRAHSREEVLDGEPGLSGEGLRGGWSYPDAQIEFPERLCVELALESRNLGADVRNHTRITGLVVREGRLAGARLRDELSGVESEVEAALVLNAAGPWVDAVNRLLPRAPARVLGGSWGTHLVLPARPAGPRGPVYAAAADGRGVFLLPWDGRLLIGTTDVPFRGDPDAVRPEPWEVEYLLGEVNRLFPGCAYGEEDVEYVTVGIRPLPASRSPSAAVTRRHFLIDHARRDGLPGLASLVGGKLTTYRSLAEQAVDWALRRLGRPPVPCPTRSAPEPVPALGNDRLDRIYGPRAEAVRRRWAGAGARALVPGCPVTVGEVLHAVEEEMARTADDVLLRRVMLLPPPPGARRAVDELLAQRSADGG